MMLPSGASAKLNSETGRGRKTGERKRCSSKSEWEGGWRGVAKKYEQKIGKKKKRKQKW